MFNKDDTPKERFGERVRRARRAADITQTELAARLGVSQGVISNVENGVSTIDAPDIPRWANAIGVPIMAFYLDDVRRLGERAEAILDMVDEDKREEFLHIIHIIARGMKIPAMDEALS